LFFAIPIIRLSIYHLKIISKRRTTNEALKNIYDKKIDLHYDHCYTIDRNTLFD
jgi:hypothetical protein